LEFTKRLVALELHHTLMLSNAAGAVVDDNQGVGSLVQGLLTSEGYSVQDLLTQRMQLHEKQLGC